MKNLQKGSIRWFILFIVLIIIGSLIFFLKRTPENAIQADVQRINDLVSIREEIVKIWQSTGSLPKNINELSHIDQTYVIPIDPKSKDKYIYEVLDSNSKPLVGMPKFKLCADFDSSNVTGDYSSGELWDVVGDEHWVHPKGFFCYIRIINPESFPVKK